MNVEEAIEKSGTKNILAKGSTKKAQKMIQNDEIVLYAINANIIIEDTRKTLIKQVPNHKGLFSIKNGLAGVIVITNKRVLFCSSVMGNLNQKQILIKDITSIDSSIHGLTKMGQFRIQGITETFIINIYKERVATELENSIQEAKSMLNQDNANVIMKTSNADEILKFKKLLDEGIITKEEFEKKKQELLK